MSAVVTISGPVFGNFILERGESVEMGRSLQTDLSVDDLRVSRRHARIVHSDRGVAVEDLSSANGTYVNGRRIRKAFLRSGDTLQVGNAALQIQIDYSDEDYLERNYSCDACGRVISLMTFADGDVIQVEDRFICPQCREKQETPAFSLVELEVIQRLDAEGFEVLEKLSLSGVVPIYKARKRSLDQLVAIKALPLGQVPVTQQKISRFVQEARTQARLRHRNIVAIYDVRQGRDLIYIVMELIEGETLQQMIERSRSRLAVRDALRITYQVARALQHAHEKGIIHRDVKPPNIMIGRDHEARLIDFGLAKNLSDLGVSITSDGETLGTWGYMAPEQIGHAREVDCRADVFGLGASLYHALAGRPPFMAATEVALVEQLEKGPPLDHLVGVPLSVVQLVMKMMQFRPEDRFQSPEELLRGMEELASELTGIRAAPGTVEFLLKMRDEESDLLQTWRERRSPKGGAFLGSFQETELLEFLGMLELNQKSGVVAVSSGPVRGRLGIAAGRIVRAEAGPEVGTNALRILLTLSRGDFEFSPCDVAPAEPGVTWKISEVVLDALRQLDEMRARTGLRG